jgi:hypothetical protein
LPVLPLPLVDVPLFRVVLEPLLLFMELLPEVLLFVEPLAIEPLPDVPDVLVVLDEPFTPEPVEL